MTCQFVWGKKKYILKQSILRTQILTLGKFNNLDKSRLNILTSCIFFTVVSKNKVQNSKHCKELTEKKIVNCQLENGRFFRFCFNDFL